MSNVLNASLLFSVPAVLARGCPAFLFSWFHECSHDHLYFIGILFFTSSLPCAIYHHLTRFQTDTAPMNRKGDRPPPRTHAPVTHPSHVFFHWGPRALLQQTRPRRARSMHARTPHPKTHPSLSSRTPPLLLIIPSQQPPDQRLSILGGPRRVRGAVYMCNNDRPTTICIDVAHSALQTGDPVYLFLSSPSQALHQLLFAAGRFTHSLRASPFPIVTLLATAS